MIIEIDRFPAANADGSYSVTIVLRRHLHNAATFENPNGVLPGLFYAETTEGLPCNRVDDGTFEVLDPRYDDNVRVTRLNTSSS